MYIFTCTCMHVVANKEKRMPCILFRDKEQYVERFDKKRLEKWNNFIVSIRGKIKL